MLRVISGGNRCKPAGGREWFPERGLHLIDIENLTGGSKPSIEQVRDVQGSYAGHLTFGDLDQVVIASSHLTLLSAALGWPHARYRIRSGPDGADLELLDVLTHEKVAARFTRLIVGSGDGAFARAVASLTAAGVQVTVVSRRDSLSARLAYAASEVIYLDPLRSATAAGVPARDVPAQGVPARAAGGMRRGLAALSTKGSVIDDETKGSVIDEDMTWRILTRLSSNSWPPGRSRDAPSPRSGTERSCWPPDGAGVT
jgi:hypothetical protein